MWIFVGIVSLAILVGVWHALVQRDRDIEKDVQHDLERIRREIERMR